MAQVLNKGEWTASLDLTDAYLHVPMRPRSRKYLRFAYQGTVYQFRVLPVGISVAPYVFTRVASQLSKFVQKFAIWLHQYLDDWLTNQQSFQATQRHMDIVVRLT
jgi:hypothetical protein